MPFTAGHRQMSKFQTAFNSSAMGHSLVTLFKTLPILELKDNPEVFPLLAIIQETIVTDLLEAGRQHMHQVAPDELRV